jgi:hypothetical protein
MPSCLTYRLGLRRVGGATRVLRNQGNPDRSRQLRALQGSVRPPRVARIAVRHYRQRQPSIAHTSRERSLHSHELRADRPRDRLARIVRRYAAE